MLKLHHFRRSDKGFTLIETLVVIVIIAIISSIAIPAYSSHVSETRTSADEANLDTAKSLAVSNYVLNKQTGAVTYYFVDENDSLFVGATKIGDDGDISYLNDAENEPYTSSSLIKGNVDSGKTIAVTVKNDVVTDASWVDVPND